MESGTLNIEEEPIVDSSGLSFELARRHKFPTTECCICGSQKMIDQTILRSRSFSRSLVLPVCLDCQADIGNMEVENYLESIKVQELDRWDSIVSYNIRKNNWVSQVVFNVMKR